MKLNAKVLLVALAASLFLLAQRAGAQSDFEWRVQLRVNIVAPSNIEATNASCHRTHRFQVEPERLPFMRLLGESTFSVSPGSQHRVPVEFDTRNIKPGQYEAVVKVKCLTCRSEPGCREDHKNLHVFLTVLPGLANWSAVHPELKTPEGGSPTRRWTGVAPEQKPPKR